MKGAADLIEEVLSAAKAGTAAKVGDGQSAAPKAEASKAAKPSGEKKGFLGGLFGKK